MTTDIGKIGWSYREPENGGFIAKWGDGKGHNFAGGSLKAAMDKLSIGGKFDYVTDDAIPRAGDLLEYYQNNGHLEYEANIGLGAAHESPEKGAFLDALNGGLKTRVRASHKESCSFCIDLGISGKPYWDLISNYRQVLPAKMIKRWNIEQILQKNQQI